MTSLASHPRKNALFALLSLSDLTLTWWLLRDEGKEVYESNPVANFFLTEFGWAGLAAFKAALVLLVVGLVVAISRRRPLVGERVLGFGCATLGLVVAYSLILVLAVPSQSYSAELPALDVLEDDQAKLNQDIRNTQAFQVLADRLGGDLLRRTLTLQEAVALLAQSQAGSDPEMLRKLRCAGYPAHHPHATLAGFLIFRAVFTHRADPATARSFADWLEREFHLAYGDYPLPHRDRIPEVWPERIPAPYVEAGDEIVH